MKKKYIKIISILTILLTSSLSLAQERYRITYDYATDKINYLRVDKKNKVIDTLDKPKIKRNSLIELKLSNVNPFAVQVQTDVQEEDLISTGQGFNFSSLLGSINSFTGGNMDLNTSNLPDSDMFKSEGGTRGSTSARSSVDDLNNQITNVAALKSSSVL